MSMTQDQLHKIKLKRLRFATDAYRDHKSIFTDPVTGEPLTGYKEWPEFRDEFIADWINNRKPIDEEEDQIMADRMADEALSELDAAGVPADVNTLADQVEVAQELVTSQTEAPVLGDGTVVVEANDAGQPAPKRRGRPPGSGKVKAVVAPVVAKRRGRPAGVKNTVKRAAAKKAGGSKADGARAIIAKYGPAGRGWYRKQVIEKLIDRLGLSAATASTYYQNYK